VFCQEQDIQIISGHFQVSGLVRVVQLVGHFVTQVSLTPVDFSAGL
jgi:hypothetical protein